jgi:Fe-S-cluster containining protein
MDIPAEPPDPEMLPPARTDLDRQLERSGIRTQRLFNRTFDRLSELEAILLGLVDVLAKRGVVDEDELAPAAQRIEEALAGRNEPRDHAVALRPETAPRAGPDKFVDCATRMPICKAVCCKLSVTLSPSEVESGAVRWDLGRPYRLRREADGRCTHQVRETGGCGVYADRPRPCRTYTCATDPRIWSDFDRMELNHEWLDSHFKPDEPQLIAIAPLRPRPPA